VAESVEEAARAAAAFALAHGLGPATRARIAGALGECVENACVHAYPLEPGPIRVRLAIRGAEAVARVEDDGVGFDVADAAHDCFESPLHNGLARVACLSEDLDLDSRPGAGTRATLRFALYRVALGEEGDLDLSERDHLSPEDAREVLHQVQALERGNELVLSPALAVVLGRLLAGPDLRRRVELALRS
jgi:anti-sigma regulatory factor (Ser/Thr protein kinase)